MHKLLTPILLGLALVAGALAALATPAPAAAQCTANYQLYFDFASSVPADFLDNDLGSWGDWQGYYEWEWASVSVSGEGGSMTYISQYMAPADTSTGLTSNEILNALGIDTSYAISSNVTITAATQRPHDTGRMAIFTYYDNGYADNSFIDTVSNSWITMTHSGGASGETLAAVEFRYLTDDTHDVEYARFDNIRITIPCESIYLPPDPPTPTPTITPTPTPTATPSPTPIANLTGTLPTPAPVITYGNFPTETVTGTIDGDIGGGDFSLPGPIPIPEISSTIRIDTSPIWKWETLEKFIVTLRTLPVLLQRYKLLSLTMLVSAALLAFGWMARTISRKTETAEREV